MTSATYAKYGEFSTFILEIFHLGWEKIKRFKIWFAQVNDRNRRNKNSHSDKTKDLSNKPDVLLLCTWLTACVCAAVNTLKIISI